MYKMIRSDIYLDKNSKVEFDYEKDTHRGISINPGKSWPQGDPRYAYTNRVPYCCEDSNLNGHKVYSVYSFNSDNHVAIFKALKQGNWDVDSYDDWVKFTANYIRCAIINSNKPDLIAIPQSASRLVYDIAHAVSNYTKIQCLDDAFIKNDVNNITLSISEDNPAYKATMRVLDNIKRANKFEAKNVPKRMLRFFRNVYRNDEQYIDVMRGKSVAVIDDSMTSKSTMMNILDVCDSVYGTSSAYGITVFKRVGSNR